MTKFRAPSWRPLSPAISMYCRQKCHERAVKHVHDMFMLMLWQPSFSTWPQCEQPATCANKTLRLALAPTAVVRGHWYTMDVPPRGLCSLCQIQIWPSDTCNHFQWAQNTMLCPYTHILHVKMKCPRWTTTWPDGPIPTKGSTGKKLAFFQH